MFLAARRGSVLFEVLAALAIIGVLSLTVARSMAAAKSAASGVSSRAALLREHVRAVSYLCHCSEVAPPDAVTDLGDGQLPHGALESRVRSGPTEAFILVRPSNRDRWLVACGVPGTKRWMP